MIIDLTEEEYMMIVKAVNAARLFYEERNNKAEVANCNHLTNILIVADKISVEVGKGITEAGWKGLDDFFEERKQMDSDTAKVIKFPGK